MATTTATTLRAFHGAPAIKARYLARLEEHRKLGQLVQGEFMDGDLEDGTFVGSAVGCTTHSDTEAAYESELGIPRVLAHLEDGIFHGVPAADAPQFAIDFLSAISVGAGLSLVAPRFLHWLLLDEKDGLIRTVRVDDIAAAVRGAGDLLSCLLSGERVTLEQWQSARDAADGKGNARNSATGAAARVVYIIAAAFADTREGDAFVNDAAFYAAACTDAASADASAAAYISDRTACFVADAASDAIYAAALTSSRMKQAAKLLQLLREAPVTA